MFLRPSLVKYQVPKNKRGKRIYMKDYTLKDIENLSYKAYNEMKNGKSLEVFCQENAISKRNKGLIKQHLIKIFLKDFALKFELDESDYLICSIMSSIIEDYDPGFIYLFLINGKLKIGKTKNILKRLSTYKSHIGEKPLIIRTFYSLNHSKDEEKIKKFLSRNKEKSIKEWFDIEDRERIIETFNKLETI